MNDNLPVVILKEPDEILTAEEATARRMLYAGRVGGDYFHHQILAYMAAVGGLQSVTVDYETGPIVTIDSLTGVKFCDEIPQRNRTGTSSGTTSRNKRKMQRASRKRNRS